MAKTTTKKDEVTANVPATLDDLYAAFSPEELREMYDVSGQSAVGRDKAPVLKVNYCTLADKEGHTIKEGNYVINQNTNVIDFETVDEDGDKVVEKRVEDIGTDLGKSPKITIFGFGTKYAFFPGQDSSVKGKEHICQSQLVFDSRVEKHVGNTLKFECQSGSCPRRAKDCKKGDKCGAQWVVFLEIAISDEEKVKAVMYVKGSSYMPFADFTKSLKIPVYFAPTKLSTKQEISDQGKPYYVQSFTHMEDKQFAVLECRENFATAKQTRADAEAYKNSQFQKAAVSQLVDNSAGSKATTIINDDVEDDIVFD